MRKDHVGGRDRRTQRCRHARHIRHAGLAFRCRRRGWGDKDLAEVPRYFREFMLQVYE